VGLRRNYGCRLTANATLEGLRIVVLENEKLRITVLVDKGTDIIEFLYKPKDIDFMWRSPMGLRNPATMVPSSDTSLGFWFDFYEGGWQDILPSGGPPSRYKGAEFGEHGETSTIPWDFQIMEDDPEKIAVKFWVRTYRSPFYVEKVLSLQRNVAALHIEEKVVNEADEEMDLMWGHHPAVGLPFLSEHCIIDAPAKKVLVHPVEVFPNQRLDPGAEFSWPLARDKRRKKIDLSKVPPPENKTADLFYLTELERGWYGITNSQMKVGFGMVWPEKVFPYIWVWQVCKGSFGYPWFGRTYNIALEPWSSYPGSGIAEAVKYGTTIKLEPKKCVEATLKAVVYADIVRVTDIEEDGRVSGY